MTADIRQLVSGDEFLLSTVAGVYACEWGEIDGSVAVVFKRRLEFASAHGRDYVSKFPTWPKPIRGLAVIEALIQELPPPNPCPANRPIDNPPMTPAAQVDARGLIVEIGGIQI